MSNWTGTRVLTTVGVAAMVVAAVGFVVSLTLNAFVFDEYDAYGEVPIPGSAGVHLPAGEVTVTFHTLLVGSTGGGGLPVPPLKYHVDAPAGVAEPLLTEDFGSTTTVNHDARVRIGYLHVPADGTYHFETDGDVGPYLSPRLAFGHGSSHGHLPVVFAALFGVAAVAVLAARIWASRTRRRSAVADDWPPPPAAHTSYAPSDEGVRIEQLKALARLRESGALTEAEYAAEKKRVLDGL